MRSFPAKLLLFGEHVLLLGASALAMPVQKYCLRTAFRAADRPVQDPDETLLRFAGSDELAGLGSLDTDAFRTDLERGMYFLSNIPTGYGLGSSGALCAAVYDRYCKAKTDDLSVLKTDLAQMERFFHGASSGIDPLTSYLGRPLLIRNKTQVEIADIKPDSGGVHVFLLDTRLPRRTGPLVKWFLEQSSSGVFAEKLRAGYLPAHEAMLESWKTARFRDFWANAELVSRFQFEYFDPMIPASVRPVWQRCLEQEKLLLKICGAGGGGYFLGFAADKEATQWLAELYPLVFPFE
ncbi:MAG: hypothetical protein KDC61_19220 [Saprospiraceae bacterium]|nr:hypothetical protein [Saprospiraceae bacterium]